MNEEDAPLDDALARLLASLEPARAQWLVPATHAVSAARARGHTCIDAGALGPGFLDGLRASRLAGAPGAATPLILDNAGRLYLHRYWQYEHRLAKALRERIAAPPLVVDEAELQAGLTRCFPKVRVSDRQRLAAETAVRRRFTVITGGPGTGKTHTLVNVLALWCGQMRHKRPRLALVAPTGKAAARMMESVAQSRNRLDAPPEVLAMLPAEATTVHRLLGALPHSPRFLHHAGNPLALDGLIVDEASMVDVALMAKLFDALPAETRIVLVGDKDQLASVEAGAVLADVCETGGEHIVQLTKNHRFTADSGIQKLSHAVNQGDIASALTLLRSPEPTSGLQAIPSPPAHRLRATLRERFLPAARAWLSAADPASALDALKRFRVLCGPRTGPFGVDRLNEVAEAILREEHLIDGRAINYKGRPIIITRNEHTLRLYNGDTGILFPDPVTGELRAWFPDADGKPRGILPARLPEHETAYALTVHKAQGSEFSHVLFLLPDGESPLLTRELLYTGITRARDVVELWWTEAAIRAALARRTTRLGGLLDALTSDGRRLAPRRDYQQLTLEM